jgi:ABC-2 type transport system permease protein
MTPIIALFGASFRSALPLRRTLLFGLLALTPALLFVLSAENRTGTAAFETLIEVGLAVLFGLVLPVIAIVLASGALGNERRDQTLSFIMLRPMPRWVISVVKTTSSVCATSVVTIFGAVTLWATYGIRHGFDTAILVGFIVGAVIAGVAYAAIIVPLGFITDRAVVIGLAYLLVFENGVVSLLTGLASLSPWRIGAAAVGGMIPEAQSIIDGVVGNLTMSAGGSLLTMGIYLAIGAALTTLLLKRRQLA